MSRLRMSSWGGIINNIIRYTFNYILHIRNLEGTKRQIFEWNYIPVREFLAQK